MTGERSFNGGCKCEINIEVIYRIYLWLNAVIEEKQCPLSEQAKVIYCIELSAKMEITGINATMMYRLDVCTRRSRQHNLILKFTYFSEYANWD